MRTYVGCATPPGATVVRLVAVVLCYCWCWCRGWGWVELLLSERKPNAQHKTTQGGGGRGALVEGSGSGSVCMLQLHVVRRPARRWDSPGHHHGQRSSSTTRWEGTGSVGSTARMAARRHLS